MTVQLLIFDFDGVVVDSELLACGALAKLSCDLGVQMTTEDALTLFAGKRASEVRLEIENRAKRSLPCFLNDLQQRTFAEFDAHLKEISGLRDFLTQNLIKRCIASSSSKDRIRHSLKATRLERFFEGGIYSADDVKRGKPCPDLFLYAAENEGVAVMDTIVIEDSPRGVAAAVAADMRVIGFLAGSHVRPNLALELSAAGATWIAYDYQQVAGILNKL